MLSKDGSQDVALSRDGSEGNYYVFSTLSWSPDSRRLAAYRVRPGFKRELQYLNSSTDQLQREPSTLVYPKPGDVLPWPQPVLFDLNAAPPQIVIDNALFSNPFELSPLRWWADGRRFTSNITNAGISSIGWSR
ncbi:DPP IV N-terminal domain-containing protein [Mesorhizobium ciceri]|uniref:DPP IV N-terminal domain-containing protein n=1 Tax=Mesorhizobium ciceri TaxID=39645 RepID=UPI00375639D2